MTNDLPGPELDWPTELGTQFSWHWRSALRPRLQGLTDAEYFWEPAPGSWNVRRRGTGRSAEVGTGEWIIDFAVPEPQPPPLTTIAWRLGHLIVGVFGERNATYFGGPAVSYDTATYAGSAARALAELDDQVERWLTGVAGLDDDDLAARCREPGFEQDSTAALVLHIHREVIHHGAEIALLRDLYARLGTPGTR